MKKKKCFMLLAGSLFLTMFTVQSAQAAGWRFPVGLTYVSNFDKISDIYIDNLQWLGYTTSSSDAVPVGLTFQPYYQFDNGLAVGGGIGPLMAVIAQSYNFYDVPVTLDVRYYLLVSDTIAPYVRAGARYHIASGDWVKGGSVGYLGSAGVEFMRNKRVGAGVELGYDSTQLELEKKRTNTVEKIRLCDFMVSIYAVF
jgi:outer membrane protein W